MDQNNFWLKFILVKTKLCVKKHFCQKKILVKKIMGQKKILVKKRFWKKDLWLNKIWVKNIWGRKKIWVEKIKSKHPFFACMGRLKKTRQTWAFGWNEGGKGWEGVPGAQPVNGNHLNGPPKVPGDCLTLSLVGFQNLN